MELDNKDVQLLEILEGLLELHEQLFKVVSEELECIGNATGSKLIKLQSQKMQLSKKISRLEQERIDYVAQLVPLLGISDQNPSLKAIVEKSSQEEADALNACSKNPRSGLQDCASSELDQW